MKSKPYPIVACRKYFRVGDVGPVPVVEVEIEPPVRSPHHEDEFMCSFHVKSAEAERNETVYGVDGLQAILLALGYLEAILSRLESSLGFRLNWAGGEAGDFGIRIPTFRE